MDRNQKLENIANGIRAASRIKDIQRNGAQSRSNSSDRAAIPSSTDLLSQILQAIVQYSPNTYRNSLGEACDKCGKYCTTYKCLKQHLQSTRSQKLNKEKFVDTLRLVEPILGPKEKNMVAKIMKLYEVFK